MEKVVSEPVWDDRSWSGLPRLDHSTKTQVCVVGLGGSGLSAILELVRSGYDVIGIDAGTVAGGAAGRNGGLLLAGSSLFYHNAIKEFGHEYALATYHQTLAEIDRIATETPDCVRRTGSLRLAYDDSELGDIRKQFDSMKGDALPVEWHDGPEGIGLLLPNDAVFNPLLRSRTLAKMAIQLGARLYEQTPVLTIEPQKVSTINHSITCEHIIVAVDGKLTGLFPHLSERVYNVRLQMLATAPTTEVTFSRPIYTRYGYDYWQQLPDGCLALGGCRDIGGPAENTDGPVISDIVQNALTSIVRERLNVRAPITHRWAAIVSYTNDHKPICEQIQKSIWVTGGYCGTGNVIGSMLARGVAQRIIAH